MDQVTDEKLDKYFALSEEAYEMAKNAVDPEKKEDAEIILDMVSRYISDAKHFREGGDKVTSFAALNYAHGWLDCGARLRYFLVTDNRLFTVDEDL